MRIEVKLFANFRQGRFKKNEMELPEGSSVRDILKDLDIPEKEAKIIIVSGLSTSAEQKLSDNDVVAIFPPIAGG